MKKVLKKFASCPIVEGNKRDIIYDLDRNNFEFIPKSLTSFIKDFEDKTIKQINKFIKESNESEYYKEYLDFLIENEFVFFCNQEDNKCFIKPYKSEFEIPYLLKSIVIDFNPLITYDKLIRKAEENNIPSISFDLCNRNYSLKEVSLIFNLIYSKSFFTINFKITKNQIDYLNYINDNYSIFNSHIYIYVPENQNLEILIKQYSKLNFIKYSINNVNPEIDFIVNYDFYFESQNFNPFYNKKIYIDSNGNILSAPHKDYKLTTLELWDYNFFSLSASQNTPWNINKSKITNCKKCEFRQMCCTSKIPVQINNTWQFESPCNYNPSTIEWNNENIATCE